MAVTAVENFRTNMGNKKVAQYKVTFPNPYVTGGVAVTAGTFGLGKIDWLDVQSVAIKTSDNSDALIVGWDQANLKLCLYTSNGNAPAKLAEFGASDASGYHCQVVVYGRP